MEEYCGDDAYTPIHMKSKILKHFGEDIILTETNGKLM